MKNTDTFLPKMNAFINFNVKKKVKLKNLETDLAANHHSQFDPLRVKLGWIDFADQHGGSKKRQLRIVFLGYDHIDYR